VTYRQKLPNDPLTFPNSHPSLIPDPLWISHFSTFFQTSGHLVNNTWRRLTLLAFVVQWRFSSVGRWTDLSADSLQANTWQRHINNTNTLPTVDIVIPSQTLCNRYAACKILRNLHISGQIHAAMLFTYVVVPYKNLMIKCHFPRKKFLQIKTRLLISLTGPLVWHEIVAPSTICSLWWQSILQSLVTVHTQLTQLDLFP